MDLLQHARQVSSPVVASPGATSRDTAPVSLRAATAGLEARVVHGHEVPVTGVSVSSHTVRPGDLYAALPGIHHHGADFAAEARTAGAVAVLTDADGARRAAASGLPIAIVESPRGSLGAVCSRIYRTGDDAVALLGVTGTNGKTSTVTIMHAILRRLGVRAGLSSTLERRVGDAASVSDLTTPEAPALHALLARMRADGVTAAAIEVSAQAVSAHRIDGLTFDVVGFTNLTHDHLDYYGDMGTYLAAKSALFSPEHARRGVVSLDSAAGRAVVERARIPITTIDSVGGPAADWSVRSSTGRNGTTMVRLTGPGGAGVTARIPLLGHHMAADTGLALVMLIEAGIAPATLENALRGPALAVRLPGRCEVVSGVAGPRVYLDIAHTPDAIEKTAAAVKAVTHGRLVMIVGADGQRDVTKRPEMGAAASSVADVVVVTDHHARFEDPATIRAGLLAGARASDAVPVHEIPSPADAIRFAIAEAEEGGAVLWTGPGLTPYLDVRGVRIPYSASDDARAALLDAGWA